MVQEFVEALAVVVRRQFQYDASLIGSGQRIMFGSELHDVPFDHELHSSALDLVQAQPFNLKCLHHILFCVWPIRQDLALSAERAPGFSYLARGWH